MQSLEEQIYQRTNKGLDIIQRYIPEARPGKKFKLREEERTASASIKEYNGVFYVKDFGDNQPALTPISLIMLKERLQYWEAVNREADQLGITTNYTPPKPIIHKSETTDKDGIKYKDSTAWNEFDKQFWKVDKKILEKYGWRKIVSLTTIKNGSKITIESTEEYPIYIRECGKFEKIYKPFDANYRFMILGEKPESYLNGVKELELRYQEINHSKKEDEPEEKVPEAIICSGERDAMVVASFGYYPIWKNSETEKLDSKGWINLTKYAQRIYNIPDIDETGLRCGKELAMQYIDLYTVEIPSWINQYRDARGKKRKDIRDYVELRPKKSDFEKLLSSAKQAKFWSEVPTKESTRVIINDLFLIHFLKINSFGKIIDENKNETYIRINEKDIVSEITITDIKDFVNNYMHDHGYPMNIQEAVFRYLRQNNNIINDLPTISTNFINFTESCQYFQFQNQQIKVTANNIEPIYNSRINYWDKQVIDHSFKKLDPSFKASDKSIEIFNTKSHFFRFLINTSRIFWREELEEREEANKEENQRYIDDHKFSIDGSRLSPAEIKIQKENLLNKIYSIGYLLHRYKDLSRTLAIWIVENKITTVNQSSGGSGKSFIFYALNKLLNIITFNGRDKNLVENKHVFDRVKDNTNIILVDDASRHLDLNYWYTCITGNIIVNPKNKDTREIPFDKSPKIAFTSNYAPAIKQADSSSLRRLLFVVMSDWYHTATAENGYRETRRIYDDFNGVILDKNYKEEYFNEDFNFMMNCLQYYLQCCQNNIYKIEADTTNIFKRIDKQNRGDYFDEWAEDYFSNDWNFNKKIRQIDIHEDCMNETSVKLTKISFKNKLKTYCQDNGIIINPPESGAGSDGRIRQRDAISGVVTEYVFFKKQMINPISPEIQTELFKQQ